MIRQGDVLIQFGEELPSKLKAMKPGRGGFVLAYGETTGHAHVAVAVGDGIELWEDESGVLWLRTGDAGGSLVHEEHGQITLPARSVGRVTHQVEYGDDDEPVRVID